MPSGWLADRVADLSLARRLAQDAIAAGRLPAPSAVPASVAATAGAVLAAGPLAAAAVASPSVRRFLYEAADTVLACILLVALLAIVLGLPVGAVYLLFKGAVYFVHSVVTSPWVTARLAATRLIP